MIPKLSVICACYNAEAYIEDSINSVINQTFQDFELIIINDGSTDQTCDKILKFSNISNIVSLDNKHNEGIQYSRNKGLLHARGEYIAIHDADDISLPLRFEKQINILDTQKYITFLGGHAVKISHTGDVIGYMSYPPATTVRAFKVIDQYKLNPIIDPTSMYRKKEILDIGGYTMDPILKTSGDFDLWCRLLLSGHQMTNIQSPLIKYRINQNGVSISQSDKQLIATDIIYGYFRHREAPSVVMNRSLFMQDSI